MEALLGLLKITAWATIVSMQKFFVSFFKIPMSYDITKSFIRNEVNS